MWKQLYEVNKGAKLTEGATLVLPETLGKVARINAPAAASGDIQSTRVKSSSCPRRKHNQTT
ncbi:MAG: hypothetical protein MR849_06130 [Oscillibacter sp.]|nr:hypothetical protein [Oscillibacter sp.]MDD7001436.1 hypothetical protein [Oscillibacter sp.]MDY5017862.1 hypothetical protein [Oscillospiraceae bacterium]